MFDESMRSFGADNLSLELNEEGTAYTIKSAVNDDSLVNLTFTKAAPGFVIGKDGTTYFGTDAKNPWGSMRHAFWPRCSVEGTIQTKEQILDLKGRGIFIHALQGMKPHHAGKFWLSSSRNSSDQTSCPVELCQYPYAVALGHYDGVYDSAFL